MAEAGPQTDEDTRDVSIEALRTKTKTVIASLLNPAKVIPTENGLSRLDWKGLAELVGISGQHIPQLRSEMDPTLRILNLWLEKDSTNSTIKNFLRYCEELDRYDVVDDTTALLDEDIKLYKQNLANGKAVAVKLDLDKYVLTKDDVERISQGLGPQYYDAFVLFADEDINFATEIVQTMEKQRNLKFCCKDRDLIGGSFEHEAIAQIIAERCNRLIVVISQAFFKSPANKFFFHFAQAIAFDKECRKIIPCLYQQCEVPLQMKGYFMLDYNRRGKLWNFWDKLYESIRTIEPVKKANANVTIDRSQSLIRPPKPPINNRNSSQTLKLKKDCVSFNSMVNLSEADSLTAGLNPSSSLNTVTGDSKKNKSMKTHWLKKLLPSRPSKVPPDGNVEEKEKKKFWQRHSKRKVAVAN